MLDPPGATLAGKRFTLERGQSLTFETYGDSIHNSRFASADARVKTEVLGPLLPLGGRTHYRCTITVPQTAAVGDVITVKALPVFRSRFDPSWAFSFTVRVT